MTSDKPYCFGKLESVFPMGNDGLRETPESCMFCRVKTDCLKTAMSGAESIRVHEEKLKREYESGRVGFFERWSRKKELARQENEKKKTALKGGNK